jgi:hypothetical protein
MTNFYIRNKNYFKHGNLYYFQYKLDTVCVFRYLFKPTGSGEFCYHQMLVLEIPPFCINKIHTLKKKAVRIIEGLKW